jgi:hypothetical protein
MNSSTDKYNQHSRERSEHLIKGGKKKIVKPDVSATNSLQKERREIYDMQIDE